MLDRSFAGFNFFCWIQLFAGFNICWIQVLLDSTFGGFKFAGFKFCKVEPLLGWIVEIQVLLDSNLAGFDNMLQLFSRKRPRRVLLRKALPSKTAEVMAVLKDCHQRLPK